MKNINDFRVKPSVNVIQFERLPIGIQGFLNRVSAHKCAGEEMINLDYLHESDIWAKATDKERLVYAKFNYYNGVVFESFCNSSKVISNGTFKINSYKSVVDVFSDFAVYSAPENKWAKIVSEPENISFTPGCTPEDKEKIKKMLAESGAKPLVSFNKTEFKAGDEVEVRYNVWNEGEWRKRTYGCFLFGKHWCRHESELEMVSFDEIRKPDPDSKLRVIAKEILNSKTYISTDSCANKCYLESTLIEMLIEMGKMVNETKK